MGYEETKKSIQSSFAQTGLDYIDLQVFLSPTSFLLDLPAAPENIQFLIKHNRYLIHAPYGGKEARSGSWRALVEAQKAGKIRSLGVSNYGVHHLDELEAYIQELEKQHGEGNGGQISVGQWELHPWLPRPDIVQWCEQRGIVREAYCPIVRGQRFDDPSLQSLAKKYGKTAAQILIRWSLQKVICHSLSYFPSLSNIDFVALSKFASKKLFVHIVSLLKLTTLSLPILGVRSPSQIRHSLPHPGECRRVRFRLDARRGLLPGDQGVFPLLVGPDCESRLIEIEMEGRRGEFLCGEIENTKSQPSEDGSSGCSFV